eukprot:58918-Pyramimonas_sp.AAC.1
MAKSLGGRVSLSPPRPIKRSRSPFFQFHWLFDRSRDARSAAALLCTRAYLPDSLDGDTAKWLDDELNVSVTAFCH